jgi:hypothetical protein
MPAPSFLHRPRFWIFVVVCLIAGSFALYTGHVWEDFYITYRSSKHLATGYGLVHNPGQRLHTFTSPLGVLLPAVASLLTFNSSDTAALWIFRAMAIGALGYAATRLYAISRRLEFPLVASAFLVACLVTDAKTVDFSINGMEIPFMIAFFAYALGAMYGAGPRRWLHLGLAWAGLMWTRPDGFVTIVLLTAGVWLFNDPARTGLTRRAWFPVLLRAAGVATVVYLPWFIFAWLYYGTPVPHTITAKALLAGPKTLLEFWYSILLFPASINDWRESVDAMFAPAQAFMGGWPVLPIIAARTAAAIASGLWLVTPLRREVRALSFTFFGFCLYLNYFPPFPSAWYLSLPSTMALLALAGAWGQVFELTKRLDSLALARALRAGLVTLAAAFFVQGCWFTVEAAREMRAQQMLVENGNRRPIGEWLHANAAPGDTVFLEPLGYIGFYSGLRTYDYPGLSSPEVVDAERRVGTNLLALIRDLKPTWIVLRPAEIASIHAQDPELLQRQYKPVRTFDHRKEVAALKIYGLDYPAYDAAFMVFKRRF